ncbi:hypothetical protein FPV67DRAFT_1452360 [Lyophyllum atratum]|nr:hypothetical protein FPV67DRAFT_1452360 [Lyophyllum atratum]
MPGGSDNPLLSAAKKLRKVAAQAKRRAEDVAAQAKRRAENQAKRRGKRREVPIPGPSPVVPNSSLDHAPDDFSPSLPDLVMPPQPAGAGPSRIQLTPAADSLTLSQILNVTHISTPPAPSPDTSPAAAFPFPRTKGGGLSNFTLKPPSLLEALVVVRIASAHL